MSTCATCCHWESNGKTEWPSKTIRRGTCSGKPAEFAEAKADDDTNLRTSFEPAETFDCSGHAVFKGKTE